MEVDSNVRLVWLQGTKFWDKIIVSALEAIKKEVDKLKMGFIKLILETRTPGQGSGEREFRRGR